jgi:phosphoribosylaminoimidazole (AIR) synthetase
MDVPILLEAGLADNIERVIPDNFTAEIDLDLIKTSKILNGSIKKEYQIKKMLKTFNCGVGFCLIVNPRKVKSN